MTWLAIGALALAVFLVLAFVLKAPRAGWEAIGAALLLGLAGYALQGHPGLPGAPRVPDEAPPGSDAQVAERAVLSGKDSTGMGAGGNKWLVIADALMRHGEYGEAANILRGAVAKEPNNSDAWLALANALVGHADGNLSPTALYAYRHAAAADPAAPGPPFFLGMAMARVGQFGQARRLWAELLVRSPKDAPWRADLEQRLARLDALMARAQAGGMAQ